MKRSVIPAKKAIILVLALVFLISCVVTRQIKRAGRYDEAVQSLEYGDYETAIEIFDLLGSFRDSRCLYSYALALRSADSGSHSAAVVARTYIARISEDYKGTLCEQIRQFRAGLYH